MYLIGLAAAIISLVIFTIYNIKKSVRAHKKAPVIIIGSFYAVIIFWTAFQFIRVEIRHREWEKYDIYGGGFMGHVKYEKTLDDYYCFSKSILMGSEDIIVNKNNVRLPLITKIYPNVFIYCEKNSPHNKTVYLSDGEDYWLFENVLKIDVNYSAIGGDTVFICFPLLYLYNLSLFVIYRKNEKELKESKEVT